MTAAPSHPSPRSNVATGRSYPYDVVRVVAMVFVIAVHSLVMIDTSWNLGWYLVAAGQGLFFTANALFFMLSGKFNLRERKNDREMVDYYRKRVRNFLIPIVILFFIRTLYNLYPHFESLFHVGKEYLKNSISVFGGMEYWFVFTLFGYLIVAPFLAPMIDKLTPLSRKIFFGIGIAYHAILFVFANLSIDFSWGYLFSGFAFTFCLGGFVESLFPNRRSLIRLGAVALVCLGAIVLCAREGWSAGLHDTSPFYTILAVGVYLLVIAGAKRLKPSAAISFLAQHSFSVYLIHMMFLMPISGALSGLFAGPASIAAYLAVVALVFACSLVAAVAIDSVVVKPVQRLFDKVVPAMR